jgi:hypothetical protein
MRGYRVLPHGSKVIPPICLAVILCDPAAASATTWSIRKNARAAQGRSCICRGFLQCDATVLLNTREWQGWLSGYLSQVK